MKKTFRQTLAVLLALVLLTTICGALASAAEGYKTGDIIEYGTYPGTDVTKSLGSVLDKLSGKWISYKYYSGTGDYSDGQMQPSDYMRYRDVLYNGDKYRGVTFDSYRPYWTGEKSSADNSDQDDNGYYTGKVYWFKFEPVKWKVLDPDAGLVMCDSIIDSQAYNNYMLFSDNCYWGDPVKTYYDSNYAESSIRQWLNNDFYNTAFSEGQKENIKTTELENKSVSSPIYDAPATNDKVFLPSYDEVTKESYGFDTTAGSYDPARQFKGSDYAKCQGLWVYGDEDEYCGNSHWRLRSPDDSGYAFSVFYNGDASYCNIVNRTYGGIVPALRLQELKSDTAGSEIPVEITNEPTITIRDYVPEKRVDYRRTIVFTADVTDPVPDAEIHWFIDGKDKGTGETYTAKNAVKSFTVQAKYVKDGETVAVSETETVTVRVSLWARFLVLASFVFSKLMELFFNNVSA